MNSVFFALWFFLPAGIANMTPIFVSHIPFLRQWNYPIDCFAKVHGKRIFGDHKTIRGLISGTIIGILTNVILLYIANHLSLTIHHLPNWYLSANPFVLGFLLSFGALLGDMVKSFFKRRLNRSPGMTWIPFDQIDYIVGGLLMSSFVYILTLNEYILILIIWVVFHILSTYIGYLLRLKDQPL